MAKYIQNENYKKKNSKRSKSSINYNYKQNKFSNSFDYVSSDNDLKGSTTLSANVDGTKVTNTGNKRTENMMFKSRGNFETKVKNNFTLKSYKKRQDSNGRRKRSNSNCINIPAINCNNLEMEGSHRSLSLNSNTDQYLEAGTYEGQAAIKPHSLGEQVPSEDDDNHSMISDYSDFCQREQYNVDCYNYYLNFGDPYVMNNGEISASDSNWFYERQPDYRVVFCGNQMNDSYDGNLRYNYPNQQEFKYRPVEQPYPYCLPNDVYMNNYLTTSYINGYMEPSIMASEYYQFQIPQPPEYVPDRYCKAMFYEEPEVNYTPNPVPQDNDTPVINLNSSLFVYNSNVRINNMQEVYGPNSVEAGEPNSIANKEESKPEISTKTDTIDTPVIPSEDEAPKESENS